jgi:long-chain acyl-CoA synthetase
MTGLPGGHSLPSMPNLAQLLTNSAAAHPGRVAIQLDDVELTYAELDAASARVAGLLRAKGVKPGDRVAVMLPNTPHFPVCYYGALRAGAVIVPMNVLLKEREVAFYLRESRA